MEKSKKEEAISIWQNQERLLRGRVYEIDAQERVGLDVIVGKAMNEQNHQERKSITHSPCFQGF